MGLVKRLTRPPPRTVTVRLIEMVGRPACHSIYNCEEFFYLDVLQIIDAIVHRFVPALVQPFDPGVHAPGIHASNAELGANEVRNRGAFMSSCEVLNDYAFKSGH